MKQKVPDKGANFVLSFILALQIRLPEVGRKNLKETPCNTYTYRQCFQLKGLAAQAQTRLMQSVHLVQMSKKKNRLDLRPTS